MIDVPIVQDVDRAFPTSRALGAALVPITAIPTEFGTLTNFGSTKWNRLFHAAFYDAKRVDWSRVGLLPQKGVKPAEAWRALEVLMGVRDIKHEHKEALFAYLASQWFVDARWTVGDRVEPFDDAELEAAWVTQHKRPGEAAEDRTVPVQTEISSKGCAVRYSNTKCPCPMKTCWVTYARETQKTGVEPLRFDLWMASGAPMPVGADPIKKQETLTLGRADEKTVPIKKKPSRGKK